MIFVVINFHAVPALVAGSLGGTLEGAEPHKILHHSPVQVEDGQGHQHVHDLVAVEPVVEAAGAQALRHAGDVDQAAQHGQRVHDGVELHGVGASRARPVPTQEVEEEAEDPLPEERLQAAKVAPRRYGLVDAVERERDVGQERDALRLRVAQQRDVDNRQRTWIDKEKRRKKEKMRERRKKCDREREQEEGKEEMKRM